METIKWDWKQIPLEIRTYVCYHKRTGGEHTFGKNYIPYRCESRYSAFLSWEAVYRLAHCGEQLDLREAVSAVGGDTSLRHGIILAKSIPAKKYGIRTGEAIWQAKEKCPGLILVPANYGLYERCSAAFMDILREYSDVVEQYSIDEAFIDMSAS